MSKRVEKKPKREPQFEDYLKPSPLIQSWMLPYLPEDFRLRETVFHACSMAVLVLVFEALYLIKCPERFCVTILTLGIGFLSGDYQSRFTIAGMKFGRAKTAFQEGRSLPDSEMKPQPEIQRTANPDKL